MADVSAVMLLRQGPPAPTIVVDCRWLHRGGAGRVTEHVVRGLQDLAEAGELRERWVLRGDAALLRGLAPSPALEILDDRSDPHAWWGQRGTLRRGGDLRVHLHQLRPLAHRRVVQMLYDVIPLERDHDATIAAQVRIALQRRYLRRVARAAVTTLVPSAHSAARASSLLGLPTTDLTRIDLAVDPGFVDEVARRRASLPQRDVVFAVGRFAPHKNLPRLVDAFLMTEFAASGGRLLLAGGTADEVVALQAGLDRHPSPRRHQVDIGGPIPQSDLVDLFATASALAMVSLDEGFGLPAYEARSVGLPAVVSDVGPLPEGAGPRAVRCDPTDPSSIAEAIDRAVRLGRYAPEPLPDCTDLARSVVGHARAALRGNGRRARAAPSRRFDADAHPGWAGRPPAATVSVLIVNFRTPELTAAAVDSALSEPETREVIVVDNASGDDSERVLTDRFGRDSRVRLVWLAENGGFGQGNNAAAALASGDQLFLLNSDATLRPGALGALLSARAAVGERAIIAPSVITAVDGKPQADACGPFPTALRIMLQQTKTAAATLEPDWVSGCAFLIDRTLFEEIGGFDPDIFMYFEDVLLCWRARAHGAPVRRCLDAVVVHIGGQSHRSAAPPKAGYYASQDLFLAKIHQPALARRAVRAARSLVTPVRHGIRTGHR